MVKHRQLCTTRMETRDGEDPGAEIVTEHVKHGFHEVLMLVRHPVAVGSEDTGEGVGVREGEGGGCVAPFVALNVA